MKKCRRSRPAGFCQLMLWSWKVAVVVFSSSTLIAPGSGRGQDAEDKQLRAIEEIRSLGGRYELGPRVVGGGVFQGTILLHWCQNPDDAMKWVKDVPGTKSLYAERRVTDDGLRHLANHPGLEMLSVRNNAKVTDGGVKQLTNLGKLVTLFIDKTSVTDDGLQNLQQLPSLKHLALHETAITDAGAETLSHLQGLESLGLKHTKISDRGVAALAGLERLQSLGLDGTAITDAGLTHVAKMKALVRVDLNGTAVTDVGLNELKALPELQVLYLAKTKVSNEGLASLQGFPKLQRIYVSKTIPAVDLRSLRERLPSLRVEQDFQY